MPDEVIDALVLQARFDNAALEASSREMCRMLESSWHRYLHTSGEVLPGWLTPE
jgi:hypothetical protein